ncbi:MAG: signal peptide peptidase SppA [Pirellulaceae bacterium]
MPTSPAPASPSPQPQTNQQPANPPPQVILYQRGAFSRFWGWLGWAGLAICLVVLLGQWISLYDYFDNSGGITEKYVQGKEFAQDKVAVLSIEGVIMEGDGFVKRQIDRIRDDENVKAIVVRVDSPGGTVTGSDYIYHHLTRLRKEKQVPMVVSMGSIAASGGYYVSMAVGDQKDAIYAEPTTTTGSIGVIIPHYDVSGLLARYDVKDDSIASHERKQMLAMTRPIPPEHREIIQQHVNAMFERFKTIIKEGRPAFRKDPEALEKLATGEVFTTDQALESKLIDKIGFIEEAIARAHELAGLDAKNTRVVEYNRPAALIDFYGVADARQAAGMDLAQLLDLSAPRGWYLATSLPAIVASPRAD